MKSSRPIVHPAARAQRGAATLIVVMLLFFLMSMVAAYTSRNLIFEQRTSANQYRSSQAFEAAEAGLEWAIAQLNAGRITNACAPSTDDGNATDQSFAQRYLTVNAATGAIAPRVAVATPGGPGSVQPSCVFDSSSGNPANWTWKCACPIANVNTAALAPPASTGPAPAYLLRFQPSPRSDLIQLESNSCTRLDNNCLRFLVADRGGTGDGVASTSVVLALRGAVTRPPAGALNVAGTLTLPGGSTLALTNTEPTVGGVTLHSVGAVPAGLTLSGIPGVPPTSTTIVDSTLTPPVLATGLNPAERTFALFFGVFPATYFAQPGMVEVDCSGGCDAAAVNLARLRNPGRAIRIRGAGTLTIDADIGTQGPPLNPALLIVEGDVVFSNGVTLNGMLYGRKPAWAWTVNGNATIRGAAVAEQNLAVAGAGGAMAIVYDKPVLTALRVSHGTFVRVPGSWKDFQ